MLDENDIPSVDPILDGGWKNLRLFDRYSTGAASANLHLGVLETVTRAMRRMRVFADAAWAKLRDDGYKPYTRAYKFFPKGDEDVSPYSGLGVGYYYRYAKGPLYESYINLSLDYADLKLGVYAGSVPKKKHPEYDADDWNHELKVWSPKASRDFFRHPLNESLAKAMPDLKAVLKKFRKTNYFKAP